MATFPIIKPGKPWLSWPKSDQDILNNPKGFHLIQKKINVEFQFSHGVGAKLYRITTISLICNLLSVTTVYIDFIVMLRSIYT